MIKIQLTNLTPYSQEGMAIKKLGESLPEITETIEQNICPVNFGGGYEHTVFADVAAEDWKNDKSEFMFKRFISSDTLTIELWNNGVKLYDLNDNSYGTYFSTFTGTASQALQKGYLLNWLDVFNANGYGKYIVKGNYTVAGVVGTWESDPFNLMGFTDEVADRSVSIVSIQNGNIMSSVFDYTGLEWKQQIRLKGMFYEDTETLEKNAYRTQDYKQKQIQDEVVENWSLELDMIPRNLSEFFIKDRLLSNELNISDYTLYNEKIHNLKGVYPESIEKTKLQDNRNSNYLIKFTSKVKNIIKRNF